jgi:hypothetical protein
MLDARLGPLLLMTAVGGEQDRLAEPGVLEDVAFSRQSPKQI